jgi:CYTH domain-containing protein
MAEGGNAVRENMVQQSSPVAVLARRTVQMNVIDKQATLTVKHSVINYGFQIDACFPLGAGAREGVLETKQGHI